MQWVPGSSTVPNTRFTNELFAVLILGMAMRGNGDAKLSASFGNSWLGNHVILISAVKIVLNMSSYCVTPLHQFPCEPQTLIARGAFGRLGRGASFIASVNENPIEIGKKKK